MQRKQLKGSLIFLLLFVLSGTALCSAQSRVLTPDQAIAVIRSQHDCEPDSDLNILREFPATEDGAKLARLAVRIAHEKHLRQFRSGILVRLLNNGGYLLMESDSHTLRPLRLYYLSRAADGRQLIDVVEIQTETKTAHATSSDLEFVMERTKDFMSELLTFPSYKLSDLIGEFFEKVPTYEENGDPETYFAVPQNISRFASKHEVEEFSALYSAVHLWAFRHALCQPQFAADPRDAVRLASTERDRLVSDFLKAKGISAKTVYDVLDPGPIHTPEQFKEKLAWLRELNGYLDAYIVADQSKWIFELNASFAGLPFNLGSEEEGFQLAVVPGLIPIWVRHANGEFKLVALSEDE